ncbi:MAG: sigma-54 dependent transcriptional regulator [Candidatus Sumerlaeia bacterium]|nr:sigma-54 dependent transcriptional regulator [Candidatus Sumerlaeia bacterium]
MTPEKERPFEGARILVVDDERNLTTMLAKILRRAGFDVSTAGDGTEAKALLDAPPPREDAQPDDPPPPFDAVLTDLQMPRMDGLTLLRAVREEHPEVPVIMLTGHGSIESAVAAMKAGAADYLIKPCNADEILLVLERTLDMRRLKSENRQLKERLNRYEPSNEIIGESHLIRGIHGMIQSVARNRSNVLITGESGAGKELIARAVHDSGPLARYPFVAVNCGALSETLLESQLFGHRRGAFTGAVGDHIGFFQAAEGGTLFLDEISEMSPHLQVKLLRAIQQHEIIPVGDTQAIRVNVRLICATNRDLEYEVRNATFRQDLFYRLNVVNIHVPALRERQEDIPLLINHFIVYYAKEYDVAPKSVDPDAMNALVAYPWPGNVRELQNVIERCFALSTAETIGVRDLPRQLFRSREDAMAAVTATRPMPTAQSLAYNADGEPEPSASRRTARPAAPQPPPPEAAPAPPQLFAEAFVPKIPEGPLTLEEIEKRQIQDAMRRAKGKRVEAAKILGIDRKRLARKLKKYGLE